MKDEVIEIDESDRVTGPESEIGPLRGATPTARQARMAMAGAPAEGILDEILNERARQIFGEGWTPEQAPILQARPAP